MAPDADSAGAGDVAGTPQQAGWGADPLDPEQAIWWDMRCGDLWDGVDAAYFAHWAYLEEPTEEEIFRWPASGQPSSDDQVLEIGRCYLGFVTVEVGFWVAPPEEG
jgi:hypothetical protein